MACAIWKSPAQTVEKSSDYEVVDSARTGGKYLISNLALGQIISFNDNARVLLTSWLCEQRRAGVEIPRIDQYVLELTKSRRRMTVSKRLEAALFFLGRRTKRLGDLVELIGDSNPAMEFCAETESQSPREILTLLKMLEARSLVEGTFYVSGEISVRPTVEGWLEIERLGEKKSESTQVFVAMWFSDIMERAYVEGIAPAISELGYKPLRIDKKEHNNKIDDEIIAEIRRSRFLVADFTCEPEKARGGVYFEAGFAQGLGIPVIWTCKDTSFKYLHFDTRQYAHIVWKESADLFFQLKNRIGATIGDGPLPKS